MLALHTRSGDTRFLSPEIGTPCRTTPALNSEPIFGDLHRVDAIWIESEMPFDRRDGPIRLLVSPYRVDGFRSTIGNAVIGAIALVGTVSSVLGTDQPRHV